MWHLSPQELSLLHTHRLVMLTKTPSGEGVRPILISTIWRKLGTAAVTSFIKPMVVPTLEGKQYGIAAKGGAASLHAFLSSRRLLHPDHWLLQLDFSNAFCTLSRQKVYEAVTAILGNEVAMPWIHRFLMQPTNVVVPLQVATPGEEGLRSTACGLAQGDPLSAMLFCITLGHAMDTLIRDRPEVTYGAYVDDVVLAAPPSHLDLVFADASAHLARYGLLLQPTKSVLWQTVPAPAQLQLRALEPLMGGDPS